MDDIARQAAGPPKIQLSTLWLYKHAVQAEDKDKKQKEGIIQISFKPLDANWYDRLRLKPCPLKNDIPFTV